jgi:hypothetical protein
MIIHRSDEAATRELLTELEAHKAFGREETLLNRVIHLVGSRLAAHDLDEAELMRWLDSAIAAFRVFACDHEALNRVQTDTIWILSADDPPDAEIWSAEFLFSASGAPVAICYSTTLANRLPRPVRDIAWQGAIDHLVGHLYPFHRSRRDPRHYDETVACRYQHLAAKARASDDWRYRVVAWLIPFVYRFHKEIPLSNYRPLESG